MVGGWTPRLLCGVATALLVPIAVAGGGQAVSWAGVGDEAAPVETATTTAVALLALRPAYARLQTRALDRAKRVALGAGVAAGVLGLAGYAGAGPVPAPATLLATAALLVVSLPVAYAAVRRTVGGRGTVVAGDDAEKIRAAAAALGDRSAGYVSPASAALDAPGSAPLAAAGVDGDGAGAVQSDGGGTGSTRSDAAGAGSARSDATGTGSPRSDPAGTDSARSEGDDSGDLRPDGGRVLAAAGAERIAGLSRLDSVLADGVDEVALAFADADREEFFGALRVCHDRGVDATVHASLADVVPAADDGAEGELLDVAVEPWPWYSRLAKRAFDVAFASVALLVLSPLLALIAVAIKLDSPGPVLYGQTRTAELGDTFPLYKFRSMVAGAEAGTGPRLSDEDAGDADPRVTRVGRVLRATHLDEIPQLLSVLRGEMSVVGPRPERPELDAEISARGIDWEQRWFVKPGLTGLAQINDVTGFEPERKLAYDLAYAERQSLSLDLRIVCVQIGVVIRDVLDLLRARVG